VARPLLATFVAALALRADAQTGPRATEEATTSPAGRLIVEGRVEMISSEPNMETGAHRDRWDLPVLRLTYSPAGSIELDAEWVGRVLATKDPDFGTVSDWGDMTLRAKWRFAGTRGGSRALGARFEVALPETSYEYGLGPDVLRMAAGFLGTQRLGRATLHGNLGIFIHDEPTRAHAQNDFVSYGLAVEAALSPGATVFVEMAGRDGDGSLGAEERAEARLGIWARRGRLRFDAALRRGLLEVHGRWGFTLGFSLEARPGREAKNPTPTF
jgi:hypothetical protein